MNLVTGVATMEAVIFVKASSAKVANRADVNVQSVVTNVRHNVIQTTLTNLHRRM